MISYWPSALLSLVLLIGICVCFKRLDCIGVDELKALVSIIFGLATSCLLLSFIWLLQKKPFGRSWPNRTQFATSELPCMHPDGELRPINGTGHHFIHTISRPGLVDQPPSYKDALNSSRPIGNLLRKDLCECSFNPMNSSRKKTQRRYEAKGKQKICQYCDKMLSSDNLNQVTIEIHDGFVANSQSTYDREKASFAQLDVNQLINLSDSPPKYHDLQLLYAAQDFNDTFSCNK